MLKKIEKIIRESAFVSKEKEPRVKIYPRVSAYPRSNNWAQGIF